MLLCLMRRHPLLLFAFSCCYVSRTVLPGGVETFVSALPTAGFSRLLCYEPQKPTAAAETVSDIFRALVAVIPTTPRLTVAMPLLATGDMGRPVEDMLPAILEAAAHWMGRSLPLRALIIAVRGDTAESAARVFRNWVSNAPPSTVPATNGGKRYDFFVSYSNDDGADASG